MNKRPPFILALCADLQGCSFHRIMTPLASLVESGIADGRIDSGIWPDEVVKAAKPDVIVWQRQVEDEQIETITRWRDLLPDALFIYELDDYLGEIPLASFHHSFMPLDISERVARGAALCERVTTTTEPMAEWLRSLGAVDVRVVPNGLPQARIKEREPRITGKLRVGWAGGMSHTGDLALLCPAMQAIGDEVTWVFLGMQPENCPVRVEYHEGVAVTQYLDAMAALDLDLVLAPLEDNPFNLCKSNLRLVEAGVIGASVIAQNLPPYHLDTPPVWAYADTPNDWETTIRSFIKAKPSARKHNADALRAWVGRYYTLERLLPRRIQAWLPVAATWRPVPAKSLDQAALPVLASMHVADTVERLPFFRSQCNTVDTLEEACQLALALGTDVLWLRPATTLSETCWGVLRSVAAKAPEIASVVPLASDGINGFPQTDRWAPIPVDTVALIEDITKQQLIGRQFIVAGPTGPAILLTRHALSMLGAPDVAGCDGNEEQAILEWGMRAVSRQWKHMQAGWVFAASLAPPAQPSQSAVTRLQARGLSTWLQVPSEGLSATGREMLELALLRRQWGGPRPGSSGFGNDYESWSALRRLQDLARDIPDEVLHTVRVAKFGKKPEFGVGYGDWVIYVDDSITLQANVVERFAAAAWDASDDVQVIFADHESHIGEKPMPEFKPEFDLELLLAQDYVTPICAVRAALPSQPEDRFDLYRIVLRKALILGRKAFQHIPHVLGTMKVDMTPERQALDALCRQVIIQDLLNGGVEVVAHRGLMGCLTVTRKWQHTLSEAPLVSIVIPTLGSSRLIQPCVATVMQHTDYPNYEILVVQNGKRKTPELAPAVAKDPRVRIVYYDGTERDGFNWSKINNWAITTHAKGTYIVTLNDDICVGSKNWLDNMMGQVVQADVGAVGARLLHPMGVVQHVGVICHTGVAGHLHKGLPNGQGGHLGRAVLTHEMSAVTGACMLFSRANFDRVKGFNEGFAHNYGDTEFCLKLRKLDLRNVVEMTAELLHPEAASRESVMSPSGNRRLIDEGRMIAQVCAGHDPYWSPNLAIGVVQNGLAIQGLNAEALAWRDFVPLADAQRILLVNDLPGLKGRGLDILARGDVPFWADLSGCKLQMTAPHVMNIRTWDVRDIETLVKGLNDLGIHKVVLRSLVGNSDTAPPVETLRAFGAISAALTVEIDPTDPVQIIPSNSAEARKLFGSVDERAWHEAYGWLMESKEAAQ